MRRVVANGLLWLLAGIALTGHGLAAEADGLGAAVFTDEWAQLPFDAGAGLSVRVVSAAGLSGSESIVTNESEGGLAMRPLREGIHIVRSEEGEEFRFLAMDPPAPLDAGALLEALPRQGQRLLAGEEFRILSMGDSVTATGDYEGLLRKMLARATGNQQIALTDHSYPGCSVDASIRNYDRDVLETKPHLAIIMYGLNDQGAGASLRGYVEQFEWLVDRVRADSDADVVVLRPTPDIQDADVSSKDEAGMASSICRTVGYGTWLAKRLDTLDVPVVDAFDAIWGVGADTIAASVVAMWPRFPLGYDKPLTSWCESDGEGDGIHPNALGHLAMARAIYRELIGLGGAPTLRSSGVAAWGEEGLEATFTVERDQAGPLKVFPLQDNVIEVLGPVASGQTVTFTVRWPEITDPTDLLRYPASHSFFDQRPMVLVVDESGGGSQVYGVSADWPTRYEFVRGRWIVGEPQFVAELRTADSTQPWPVDLPTDEEIGRISLRSKFSSESGLQWAIAELAFLRYGEARNGEAVIDGNLNEWQDDPWQVVGAPVQARWAHGPADHRDSPSECTTRWAFRAGEAGISVAVEARGDVADDEATIFFDPRSPEELGTPGPYFWLGIARGPDGNLSLRPGETSPPAGPRLTGKWTEQDGGADLEFFVPYGLMRAEGWPTSGDLGVSIDWDHRSGTGKPNTHLQWFEDGHPWSPLWYGVVRLRRSGDVSPLPFLVRVK